MVEKQGDRIFLTPEEQTLAGVWQPSFTCEEIHEVSDRLLNEFQQEQEEINKTNQEAFPDSFKPNEDHFQLIGTRDALARYALMRDLEEICPRKDENQE